MKLTAEEKEKNQIQNKTRATIKISSKFNGEIFPETVEFDGTIKQWKNIKDKSVLNKIPCINCKDGLYIQKL